MKYIVRIDSSPQDSNFVTQFKNVYREINKVRLLTAAIFNSSYIVNAYNSQFSVTVGTTIYPVTLAQGNYTAGTLSTQLQTALNNAGTGLTFTVMQSSANLTFTVSAGSAFSMNFSEAPLAARLLGFPAINTASATSITSTQCYQINNTPVYYLRIQEIPGALDTPFPCFEMIPNNVAPGALMLYKPESPNTVRLGSPTLIYRLSVQLLDRDGNIVNLNDTSVLLEFEFEKD